MMHLTFFLCPNWGLIVLIVIVTLLRFVDSRPQRRAWTVGLLVYLVRKNLQVAKINLQPAK